VAARAAAAVISLLGLAGSWQARST